MTAVTTLVHDSALPHRDILFDDAGARAVLSRAFGTLPTAAIRQLTLAKVKYRVGESLRVLHRVDLGDDWRWVAARMMPGDGWQAYRAVVAEARPSGPFPGVAVDATTGTVLWTFPNDRKLATAGELTGGSPVWAPVVGHRAVDVELVSYTPERAAIARVVDRVDQRTVGFAKVHADDGATASAAVLGHLQASLAHNGASLRLPRVLACDPGRCLVLVDAVRGVPMSSLEAPQLRWALASLGTALATLHTLPVPALPPFGRFAAHRLARSAALIGQARPDVSALATRVAGALAASVPASGERVCLHGDVNSRNWLAAADGVGLIDFDQAAAGPAAADVGAVLASLRYRTLVRAWPRSEERVLAAVFLAGYARIRRVPDATSLDWHGAAALLVERGLRSITRLRPEGLAVLDRLLLAAQRWALEGRDA